MDRNVERGTYFDQFEEILKKNKLKALRINGMYEETYARRKGEIGLSRS